MGAQRFLEIANNKELFTLRFPSLISLIFATLLANFILFQKPDVGKLQEDFEPTQVTGKTTDAFQSSVFHVALLRDHITL